MNVNIRLDDVTPEEFSLKLVQKTREERIEYARNWRKRRVEKDSKKPKKQPRLSLKQKLINDMRAAGATEAQIKSVL